MIVWVLGVIGAAGMLIALSFAVAIACGYWLDEDEKRRLPVVFRPFFWTLERIYGRED